MTTFPDPLRLELMTDQDGWYLRTRAGRPLYRLLSRFRCQSQAAGIIDVPAGYVTDLASFPQWTLSLLGDIAQAPSVPHDYAYSTHCIDREQADAMLYQACMATGIPRWKAAAIYLAARLFGASHWNEQAATTTE